MSRGKRFFLIVGIPALIISGLFSSMFFIGGFLLFLTYLFIMYFAFIHNKMKKNPWIRLSKFALIFFLMGLGSFFSSFWNPTHPQRMGSQFLLDINKSDLIDPNSPVIASLENDFNSWVANKSLVVGYGQWVIYYANDSLIPFQPESLRYYWPYPALNFTNITFNQLTFEQKLYTVNYFINTKIINWTSDQVVYGSADYYGTVAQVLAKGYASNWENFSTDDCDGIAVVTVSLLQRMGFNAYIGAGKEHWFTVVLPKPGDNFNQPLILNSWDGIHLWYYFNQYQVKLGQPIIDTLKDVWLMDQQDPSVQNLINFIHNNYAGTILICSLISLLGVMFFVYPREHDEKTQVILQDQRKRRQNKLKSKKFIGNRYNPLYWLGKGTYVRVGNPFQRIYFDFITDFIWVTVVLFLGVLGATMLGTSPYIQIYAMIMLWIILFVLDGQYILKLKRKLLRKRQLSN